MKFIPKDKMKSLREASRNGDERARKIISMQLDGMEDYSSLVDDYFKPQPEIVENPTGVVQDGDEGLQKFLRENEITKDSPDYQSFVDDYYKEFPQQEKEENNDISKFSFLERLIESEIEAVNLYNAAFMEVMNNDDLSDTERKGLLTDLDEIKRDEIDHLDKLRRIKTSLSKKEENQKETLNKNLKQSNI